MTVAALQQKCGCEGVKRFSGKNKEGNSDTASQMMHKESCADSLD